jgi:exonuclease III
MSASNTPPNLKKNIYTTDHLNDNNSHKPNSYQPNLNITAINVRGLNQPNKLAALTLNLKNQNSIILCSETKNNQQKQLQHKVNNVHLLHSKPSLSPKNGAAIIVGSHINKHINKIFTENEYWVAIQCHFTNARIIILSLYLPHDKQERIVATNSLIKFMRRHKKLQFIIGGDFNTYPENNPSING